VDSIPQGVITLSTYCANTSTFSASPLRQIEQICFDATKQAQRAKARPGNPTDTAGRAVNPCSDLIHRSRVQPRRFVRASRHSNRFHTRSEDQMSMQAETGGQTTERSAAACRTGGHDRGAADLRDSRSSDAFALRNDGGAQLACAVAMPGAAVVAPAPGGVGQGSGAGLRRQIAGGRGLLRGVLHKALRKALHKAKYWVPDYPFLMLAHLRRVGRFPNLRNPVTYNDYILLRCLHPDPLWTTLADKLAVREFVKARVGEAHLVPLYAAPEVFTREVFDALPAQFVMKANHGCAFVEIVRDKSQTSFEALERLARKWLAVDYSRESRERHYKAIKPRLYFEKLLLDTDGNIPADIKMNMFGRGPDGPIIYTGIVSSRFSDPHGDVFDANWNRVDLKLGDFARTEGEVPPPENWSEIVAFASRLADGLGYVRVDIYVVDGHIYFGELTFTPGAGVFPFYPDRIDYEWGALMRQMSSPPFPGAAAGRLVAR
jgi:hypothetical protein